MRRAAKALHEVVIVAAVRTPVGSFQKSLASVSATQLGSVAIRGAIDRANLKPADVEEVYMGNVISANIGQAPARQAALLAGCPNETEATTINKVCASGLKAVMLATQGLETGARKVMVAGGMESMSQTPFLVERGGLTFGHQKIYDSIVKDGLTDVYDQVHMGVCAEETAAKYNITREQQDAHAIQSYKRSATAWEKNLFANEIVPVSVKSRKGETVIDKDEEFTNVKFDKIPSLKGVFVKNGTVTAANSSTLNDGASALVLMTKEEAERRGIKPLARILSYADAACAPKLFTIAPSLAIPKALEKAGISVKDVSLFEINEAFSVVVLANEKILGLDPSKVNVAGGGVSLGHPIGSSGSRILVSLVHLLKPGQIGVTGICNGGGAASAVVVERM